MQLFSHGVNRRFGLKLSSALSALTFGRASQLAAQAIAGSPCGVTMHDCCTTGEPGCSGVACCELVCDADAFCCDVMWDAICVNMALSMCGRACGAGICPPDPDHDCCTAGSPGCDDSICCEAVCLADPFCCDTAWDDICVMEAQSMCGLDCGSSACSGASNDCCLASPDGTLGCSDDTCCKAVCAADPFCCTVAWDGVCASQALQLCDALCADLPDCYTPVHACCEIGIAGCDDPSCCVAVCAADLFCCQVAWDSICVEEASVLCGQACPVPCGNAGHDCCTEGAAGCDDIECCQAICAIDPFCCEQQWDHVCAAEGACVCYVCAAYYACDGTSLQDCFVPGDMPGCGNVECCQITCNIDPYCGDVQWDAQCAALSALLCTSSECVECRGTTTFEQEPCGQDTNGGCGDPKATATFELIECGQVVCGTFRATKGQRDEDCYQFTLSQPGTRVTASAQACTPAICLILNQDCPPVVLATSFGNQDLSASAILDSGTYTAFVTPSGFHDLQCGAEESTYHLELSCVAGLPGDVTGNGIVDVDDLLAVINSWGDCDDPDDCPADLAPTGGNGVVDVDDLLVVINNWS